jgi:hypothetical protein
MHAHVKPVACSTCGCSPCSSPGFCRLCREVDGKAALRTEPDHDLPPAWDTMSVGGLLDELNRHRPTPQSTIEAIMHCVRKRGVAALNEPANVERLKRCDEAAIREVNARIERMTKGF